MRPAINEVHPEFEAYINSHLSPQNTGTENTRDTADTENTRDTADTENTRDTADTENTRGCHRSLTTWSTISTSISTHALVQISMPCCMIVRLASPQQLHH